jgi:hypothetical protein
MHVLARGRSPTRCIRRRPARPFAHRGVADELHLRRAVRRRLRALNGSGRRGRPSWLRGACGPATVWISSPARSTTGTTRTAVSPDFGRASRLTTLVESFNERFREECLSAPCSCRSTPCGAQGRAGKLTWSLLEHRPARAQRGGVARSWSLDADLWAQSCTSPCEATRRKRHVSDLLLLAVVNEAAVAHALIRPSRMTKLLGGLWAPRCVRSILMVVLMGRSPYS